MVVSRCLVNIRARSMDWNVKRACLVARFGKDEITGVDGVLTRSDIGVGELTRKGRMREKGPLTMTRGTLTEMTRERGRERKYSQSKIHRK